MRHPVEMKMSSTIFNEQFKLLIISGEGTALVALVRQRISYKVLLLSSQVQSISSPANLMNYTKQLFEQDRFDHLQHLNLSICIHVQALSRHRLPFECRSQCLAVNVLLSQSVGNNDLPSTVNFASLASVKRTIRYVDFSEYMRCY